MKSILVSFSFLLTALTAVSQMILQYKADTISIRSAYLNETRKVWVQKPNGYDTSRQKYPVLFVLDADGHFNYVTQYLPYLHNQYNKEIPAMITIGIPSARRSAILTPRSGIDRFDTISQRGEAKQFIDFIEKELLPQLEQQYRAGSFRIVLAHSLAGLFAFYSMYERPKLFGAVIAASSSAGYADGILYKKYIPAIVQQKNGRVRYLYFTVSDNDLSNYKTENVKLSDTLRKYGTPEIKWNFENVQGMNHWTIAPYTFYKGLLHLFSPKGFYYKEE